MVQNPVDENNVSKKSFCVMADVVLKTIPATSQHYFLNETNEHALYAIPKVKNTTVNFLII